MFLLTTACFVCATAAFQSSSSPRRIRGRSAILQFPPSPSALYSSSSDGTEDQSIEALQSLAKFHEGSWQGRAKSFAVTADVAAGIVQRKDSPSYQCFVKVVLDAANRDYLLQETLEWEDSVSSRSISFKNSNVDVDAVDASYSLDSTLPDFPNALAGTDKLKQFLIEHCVAVSDDERARCLVFYGADQNLIRIVVCEETRIPTENEDVVIGTSDKDSSFSAADLLEMQSDVDRLVDKMTGDSKVGSQESGHTSGTPQEQLKKLQDVVSLSESTPSDENDGTGSSFSKHSVTLLEVSSGVWLGDSIIRDVPMVPMSMEERGKGFGPKQIATIRSKDAFAKWSVGVQKVAWRWMWNFGDEIRQVNDIGKFMGAQLEPTLAQSLSGTVCINEGLSRKIKPDDQMVYIDWNGENVGFVLGSYSVQVPRYLKFDKRQVRPFTTEFTVFQSAPKRSNAEDVSNDEPDLKDMICSKVSRVYNYEGRLKQGCTSFFTFKRFGTEKQDT